MAKPNGGTAAKGVEVTMEKVQAALTVQQEIAAIREENAALKAQLEHLEPETPRIVFSAPYVATPRETMDENGKAKKSKETKTLGICSAEISGMILGRPNLLIGDIRIVVYRDNPKHPVVFMPAAGMGYSSRRHILPKKQKLDEPIIESVDGKQVTITYRDDPNGKKELRSLETSILDAWQSFGSMPWADRWGVERELAI